MIRPKNNVYIQLKWVVVVMERCKGGRDAGNVCLALGGSYKDLCLEIFYFYLLSFQQVWLFHNKRGKKTLPRGGKKLTSKRILRMSFEEINLIASSQR